MGWPRLVAVGRALGCQRASLPRPRADRSLTPPSPASPRLASATSPCLSDAALLIFSLLLSLHVTAGRWHTALCLLNTPFSPFFSLFLSLLNKKKSMKQLGGNRMNPLCKPAAICIMSYARNMQISTIIYGCLHQPQTVPIT